MQIVILVAGKGTRMGELTREVPKPMLLVNGKPILAHKIEMLPEEITEVLLVVGYLKEKIMDFFGDEYAGRKISYSVQDRLHGTGGALHIAKDLLREKFMVMMGDDLYHPEDIRRMLGYELAILAHEVKNPRQFGVIKDDEQKRFRDIIEKPKDPEHNLVNTGLYVLNHKFFDYELVAISETEYGLPQTLLKIARDFPVYVERARAWHPIGNPVDLVKAQELIHIFK